MAGGGTQQSLRKYLGAIKDSTTVGLAKVNSDYKELDIAIVRATNHVERPVKEKHIKENIVIIENEETVVSVVALEGQNLIIKAEDISQGSLIPSTIILDEAPENEATVSGNDPAADLPAEDPIEAHTNQEELPANNIDISAVPEEENLVNAELSSRLIHDIQPADSITISGEEPVMNVIDATPNEEIQAVRAEMLRLKEELKIVKGELIDVKRELKEVKEKVPGTNRSEDIINGAICLFQKLVRRGFISPEVVMDPSLWN